MAEIGFIFQGGFAPKGISLVGSFEGTEIFATTLSGIANSNASQKFPLSIDPASISELRILFTEGFDFYNRIVIYSLTLKGIQVL